MATPIENAASHWEIIANDNNSVLYICIVLLTCSSVAGVAENKETPVDKKMDARARTQLTHKNKHKHIHGTLRTSRLEFNPRSKWR